MSERDGLPPFFLHNLDWYPAHRIRYKSLFSDTNMVWFCFGHLSQQSQFDCPENVDGTETKCQLSDKTMNWRRAGQNLIWHAFTVYSD